MGQAQFGAQEACQLPDACDIHQGVGWCEDSCEDITLWDWLPGVASRSGTIILQPSTEGFVVPQQVA